jgi:hypothetical protein
MFDISFSYRTYLYVFGGLHLPVFQRLASAFVYILRTEIMFFWRPVG